jgi:hypothetical protein
MTSKYASVNADASLEAEAILRVEVRVERARNDAGRTRRSLWKTDPAAFETRSTVVGGIEV